MSDVWVWGFAMINRSEQRTRTRASRDGWYPVGDVEECDLHRAANGAVPVSPQATEALHERPRRPPNHEAANRAFVKLAEQMGRSPRTALAAVAETAMALCRAGSAGVGVVESDDAAGCLRWQALAGALSEYLGATARCEILESILERNAVQLLRAPQLHFDRSDAVKPAIVEALVVPFSHAGRKVGTVWVAHHDEKQFDAEDARLLDDLARFAGAAHRVTVSSQRKHRDARRMNEFIAVLAHELRSPLGALDSAMRFLQLRVVVAPDRTLEELADRGRRQIKAMTRLIDDLFDVARIAQDKIELRRERVELTSVMKHAIDTSRPQIEAAHHELVVTAPREPVWIDCDPIRMAQAITNLLNNAAKYMPEHGRIDIVAVATRVEVAIWVCDRGIGLPPEELTRIFDLFRQIDTARPRYQGGLGFGLSLVKRLVELHGGTVTAHSKGVGFGSEFVIRLPVGLIADPPTACRS